MENGWIKCLFIAMLACWACSGSTKNGQRAVQSGGKLGITAVLDTSDWDNIRMYYRLADGRIVGEDSVYSVDAIEDCESDGKIRFRDRITDKVGFFDNTGKVVVPAIYNDASRFYNGVARAIKGAKRVGWDGEDCDKGDCEHFSWAGGEEVMINARNEVLVERFEMEGNPVINWYSMRLQDMPGDTTLYCSVKGVSGKWYVFLDYQKEFDQWFWQKYLAASPDLQKLREFTHDSLVSSLPEYDDWVRMSRDAFTHECGSRLAERLQVIRDQKVGIFTGETMFGLNTYIHTGGSFDRYFDGCGDGYSSHFPAFDVISNFMDANGRLDYQEYYTFLRTENGYKLIGVSWIDKTKRR